MLPSLGELYRSGGRIRWDRRSETWSLGVPGPNRSVYRMPLLSLQLLWLDLATRRKLLRLNPACRCLLHCDRKPVPDRWESSAGCTLVASVRAVTGRPEMPAGVEGHAMLIPLGLGRSAASSSILHSTWVWNCRLSTCICLSDVLLRSGVPTST